MSTPELRIFLSIVTNEFGSYRALLTSDLKGPRLEVKSQEDFITTGGTTLQKLDDYIRHCHAVVHLVGDATGSCPEAPAVAALLDRYPDLGKRVPVLADVLANGALEISYTQWEAYLALYHRKELFIYCPAPGAPRDARFVLDQRHKEAQQRHFERLTNLGRDRGTFADQERLSSLVLRGLFELGWGEMLPPPDSTVPRVEVSRLPSCDCPALFGRDDELKLLDEAWEQQTHRNVVCLVAWGGVGKTSLIHHWRKRMEQDGYRGARRIYAYSFYNQGTTNAQGSTEPVTTADDFFKWALELFGAAELEKANPATKGASLAQLVRQERTLLFLDGLEPLQVPPLTGVAVERRQQPGTLKDKALLAFLKELAADNPGLCIITTRYPVIDLKDDERSVREIILQPLTHRAGAQLLRERGVRGTQEELERASEEFGGHGLALTLLGNLLRDIHGGDVGKRGEVRDLLEDEDQRGGHAWRVMDSYEKWFREGTGAELNVLRLLGLFDRPADGDAVAAVLAPPAIPGLTDALLGLKKPQWQAVLNKLRETHLLAGADPTQPDTLDTHPLVREHFGNKLWKDYPDAWREGNTRLYEHFRDMPFEHRPDTFEEMRPLFLAVFHGCEADRHEEALEEVYWDRILREDGFFSTDILGAFGDDLMAASCFFSRQWDQLLPSLSELQKARVQAAAGWDLRGLGRMKEAIQALQGSMDRYAALEMWGLSNVSCSQIAQIHLDCGALPQALKYAKRKQELAERSARTFWLTGAYVLRALVLFQMGPPQQQEYEELCRKVWATGIAEDAGDAVDHTFIAFRWCDLLLGQLASPCFSAAAAVDSASIERVVEEVEKRCEQIVRKSRQEARPHPAEEAADLLRGRVRLVRALHGSGGQADLADAERLLDRALQRLRTGAQELFLSGLRARAALYLACDRLDAAEEDLNEARKVAERGQMRLYEVDCRLQFIRLRLARGERDRARRDWSDARELIARLKYQRRGPEVEELGRLLAPPTA